jgi:LCP family protein required for cell wall assembly
MLLALSITATYASWMVIAAAVVFLLLAVVPWAAARHRPHRSWGERTMLSACVFLVVVAVTAAGVLVWFNGQITDIPRVRLSSDVIGRQAKSSEPQNFLLVGVDQAKGLGAGDPVAIGRNLGSTLSDTVMVLRVIPKTREAYLISFPRDLWVPIAGTGHYGKLNSALSAGGPETLIRTLQENFGISVNHYVQVNFVGFERLVDLLGGVPVWFPESVRDPTSGLGVTVPSGGACVRMDGNTALAFVRSRRDYQTLHNGRWVLDPTADLGRISRQQLFMRKSLTQAVNRGARNPATLSQLVNVGKKYVVLDDKLTIGALLDLGSEFSNFDPSKLRTLELPVTTGYAGAASVVFLTEDQAQDELNIFRGVSNAVPTVKGIRVDIRNGSGTSGQGTVVSNDLTSRGFTVVGSSDADSFDYQHTVIRYAHGDLPTAIFLARYLDQRPVFEESTDLGGASVVLVTGKDFTTVRTSPRPVSDFSDVLGQTTTTTVPHAPSSSTTSTTIFGAVPEQPANVNC